MKNYLSTLGTVGAIACIVYVTTPSASALSLGFADRYHVSVPEPRTLVAVLILATTFIPRPNRHRQKFQ